MANFDVKESIDTKSDSTGVATAGDNIMPMAGDIIMFAGATAPTGWAICDGYPSYGNSAFSHSAYNVASISTNNSHSDHSHTFNFTVNTSSYAGSNFIQATNATGTSKCLRSGHSHSEGFAVGTNNMDATPNHNHNLGTSRTNSESHTHTAGSSSTSGSASATTINVPYLSLNYIMKL